MNNTQALFDSDVAAVERDAPLFFIFQGKQYVGQRTPIVDKLMMQDAGFQQLFDFTMEVRLSQFSASQPPAHEDVIEISEVDPSVTTKAAKYRIVSVMPDQLGVVAHYALKQDT